jgi:hypothetical protein
MNSNSISHRLFIAALAPSDQASGKRPSGVRALGANGATKPNATKPVRSLSALTPQPVGDWSWSGWQHNTI